MAERDDHRGYREHWRGNPYGRDWDEAAGNRTGDEQPLDEGRVFARGYVGPRYGAAESAAYTGRGYTGGYGQNGSDPGERVSPYGDRIYRGGVSDPKDGGGSYHTSPRQDHPGEYRTYRDPGHRGVGPQGYIRSDQRISDDVHDRLTEDDHVDASWVTVAVQDGEVTLSGRVTDRQAKHHAEAIVEHIGGVKHVQNNLRVDATPNQATATLGETTALGDQAEGDS